MPKDWSTDLQEIHKAYRRRDTLDLYLADGEPLRLSRGKVSRVIDGEIVNYDNWISSVEDLRASIDTGVDRITINCQNVNSLLGFNVASNLRLLDYAVADYGKIYQSVRNESLIEDIPQVFPGVIANAEVNETRISFELIVDYESLGAILASRALSPRCWWKYKNGIECTSASGLPSCPKTRFACVARGAEKDHGGFEFFEEPTQTLPGGGGNDGGTGGGNCFTLDTKIWTPNGEIPFGEIPLGVQKERFPVVSFNKETGEINYDDEFDEVWEYETTGFFSLEFEHAVLNVTPTHRLFVALNQFVRVNDFTRNDTVRAVAERWFDSTLKAIKWNSDQKIKVRNGRVKKNGTYFANRCAVSNSKNPNIEL